MKITEEKSPSGKM